MVYEQLDKHFLALATVEKNDNLFLSCYLNIENGEKGYREYLDKQIAEIRNLMPLEYRECFEQSLGKLEAYIISRELKKDESKGIAVFTRSGESAFFKAINFKLTFENLLVADFLPRLHPLAEMKTEFNRYAVVVAENNNLNIVKVNTGNITNDLWNEQPELYIYNGKIWSNLQYRKEITQENLAELPMILTILGKNHEVLYHDNDSILNEVIESVQLSSFRNPIHMDKTKVKLAAISLLDNQCAIFKNLDSKRNLKTS